MLCFISNLQKKKKRITSITFFHRDFQRAPEKKHLLKEIKRSTNINGGTSAQSQQETEREIIELKQKVASLEIQVSSLHNIVSLIQHNFPTLLRSSSNSQQPIQLTASENQLHVQSINASYYPNEDKTNKEPMHIDPSGQIPSKTDNNNELHAPMPPLPDATNLPTNGQIPHSSPYDALHQGIKIPALNSDLMRGLSNTSFLSGLRAFSNNSSTLSEAPLDLEPFEEMNIKKKLNSVTTVSLDPVQLCKNNSILTSDNVTPQEASGQLLNPDHASSTIEGKVLPSTSTSAAAGSDGNNLNTEQISTTIATPTRVLSSSLRDLDINEDVNEDVNEEVPSLS